jgi:hypothetical protein
MFDDLAAVKSLVKRPGAEQVRKIVDLFEERDLPAPGRCDGTPDPGRTWPIPAASGKPNWRPRPPLKPAGDGRYNQPRWWQRSGRESPVFWQRTCNSRREASRGESTQLPVWKRLGM